MEKKIIISICLIGLMLVFSGMSVNAIKSENKQVDDQIVDNKAIRNCVDCTIVNITVQEAWDLLTDTGNGIQIPIDVRRADEWYSGFIDTPYPENPRWYCLDLIKEDNGSDFAEKYSGQDVVLYCKGGYRSLMASYIICFDSNYTGTIYNMLGGITAWIAAGYPIRNNTPPAEPLIEGPTHARAGEEYDYEFSTTDDEEDVVYYWIIWGDDCPAVEWIGPYDSGEIVTLSHTFENQGTYKITAQARDFYGNESDIGELDVTMPKNKAVNFNLNLLNWLFERFPFAFPVMRQLIKL